MKHSNDDFYTRRTLKEFVHISEVDEVNVGYSGKKSRLTSDNESLFGPTNSP